MERKDRIIEIAKQVFQQRAEIAVHEIAQEFLLQGDNIRKDFQRTATELVQLAKHQQQQGKGAIQYVVISYLYSSAITKSNVFQIAFLDEHDYLDPIDTSVYWCPSFIYRPVAQDMLCLREAVDKELIRMKPYELDAAQRGYINEFYHAIAGMFFVQVAKDTLSAAGIHELLLQDEVQFLYGGLMDQVISFDSLRNEVST